MTYGTYRRRDPTPIHTHDRQALQLPLLPCEVRHELDRLSERANTAYAGLSLETVQKAWRSGGLIHFAD